MNLKILMLPLLVAFYSCVFATDYTEQSAKDKLGREYIYYSNDPVGLRIYTFSNGLQLYVSENEDEPQIQTYITVKAGSTYDPKETTGLAHYLEHMMFKGSSKLGSLDWEKEKPLLDSISLLFEKHKATENKEEKAIIYAQIDSLSQLAAGYVAPNEYDYLTRSLGASGTNAYTSDERTVYVNKIPSNSLRNFLILERERFNELVLRLFHTELETVYEEFNMGQDNDQRKVYYSLFKNVFPTHPYGTQTTIGTAEHLKNPSMVNIHKYWSTYYVPNNMAICMSGDLDPAQTAYLVDSLWGDLESHDIPELNLPKELPITEPVIKEVYGPNPEAMIMAFRTGGVGSDDELYVSMIDYILSSGGKAGLVDLNLVKAQKVLYAGTQPYFMKDYGVHLFYGMPRQDQSLDEVRELLLGEIEKIKTGDFDDWQLEAIINDMRLHRIRAQESVGIANEFVETFGNGQSWDDYLSFPEKLEEITKEDLMAYAKKLYTKDNYVVINKLIGTDTAVVKVEKPVITPIPINRDVRSDFAKEFVELPKEEIEPVFINYDSVLSREKLQDGISFNYIKNDENELFYLYYIIEKGTAHDKKFALAVNYLEYLGTDKYSSEELAKELFKHGLEFGVSTGEDQSYIYMSGLDKSFEKAVELLEHIVKNAKPDEDAYANLVFDIMKNRADAKLSKGSVQSHLINYGKYGKNSPMHDILTEAELKSIKPKDLVAMVNDMCNYQHDIFYYGHRGSEPVKKIVQRFHKVKKIKPVPEPKKYEPLKTEENTVFFVDYDMVQSSLFMLSRGDRFDKAIMPESALYNEYFGAGLSSIVFQEIRESKALAYRAYSYYKLPSRKEDYAFLVSFVGTSPDKLNDAVSAMQDLLNKMPINEEQILASKSAIQKRIASDRIIKSGIYFSYLSNKRRGIDYDIRKEQFEKIGEIGSDELQQFFDTHVAGKPMNYLVMGNKDDIDLKSLEKLGTVHELSLEDIFGY